jgi:membrane protein
MKWLHRFLLHFRFYRYCIDWTKVVILPGFAPLPLYTVGAFFFEEIRQGTLTNKASSLAYNFMLALFPGTIFLFTLIPYIPIDHFQDQLLELISLIMPDNAYQAFDSTIEDIIKNQNGKLLSFGFLSTMYFATNGVSRLMQAFNKSTLTPETRSWLKRRWVALWLTIVISISFLLAITIMIIGYDVISLLKAEIYSKANFWTYLIALTRWVFVVIIFFVTVSLLYRYGPANRRRWKFLSPGSLLATFLAVISSLGFTFYIDNFSSYNKVYGSIGTLIVVMIWLYLNSLILLIGFELNASIDLSKRNIKIEKPRYNTFRSKKHLVHHK